MLVRTYGGTEELKREANRAKYHPGGSDRRRARSGRASEQEGGASQGQEEGQGQHKQITEATDP